ncbi:MAG: ankyrin repeat domain-containing protein [Candidatus Babeliaceae bacterium]
MYKRLFFTFVVMTNSLLISKQSPSLDDALECIKDNDAGKLEAILSSKREWDVNDGFSQPLTTLMHEAVNHNNALAIDILLDHKAAVNVVNNNNETPIHRALEKGNGAVINLLLKKGDKEEVHKALEIQNKWGQTPLDTIRLYFELAPLYRECWH